MWLQPLLIGIILASKTNGFKITRSDLLQYQYQQPFNQNQSLSVEKYLKYLEDFQDDLSFVEKALDSVAVLENHENQTNFNISKFTFFG